MRKEFGGLKSNQVKRLKDLEKENERPTLGKASCCHVWRSGSIEGSQWHERDIARDNPIEVSYCRFGL
jgi:hypothetical protein